MSADRTTAWMSSLFAAIDARDADGFVEYLCEDGVFRFGNAEPVAGRAAIREAVAGFFSTIAGLEHRLTRTWRRKTPPENTVKRCFSRSSAPNALTIRLPAMVSC